MASYAALTTIVHGCRRTHTHHTHARACTPTATRPPAPTTTRGNSRFAALRPSLSTAAVRGRPCRVYTPAMMAATVAEAKPTIGFLGMGIMGVPMTKNLLAAGYQVVVWNRTADKCTPAVEAGATRSATARAVAEAADITFAMLSDPEAALAVVIGDDGVAAGLSAGKGYVDVSTVDATTATRIASLVNATGAQFLEAPVSGSKQPANDGALIFLTAGDRALYDIAVPLLDVMGKAHFFLGDVGQGAQMKLVVNMVMGSMMAAFGEGLELANKSGLSQETMLEVVALGAIASPMFAIKGPSMIAGKFPTAFPLKHQQKDMRLALELGDTLAQPLPVAAAADAAYRRAMDRGDGDADFSAVLKAIETP